VLRLEVLDDDAVAHAFFTRAGGVSEGLYAALNCGYGSGDRRDHVAENRARAARRLGVADDALVTGHQVHGIDVAVVAAPWATGAGPKVDAMVTDRPGIALGILTADCAPVLFADPQARVIGAAHAGWRGALAGVIEATVATMERLGAARARIRAAVGPCIAQQSYEVGPEFPAPFLAADAANRAFFAEGRRAGRFQFDLAGYVGRRLDRLGLAAVAVSGADTCAEPDRFFSYRRTCLAGERDYGRLVSAIALG